MRLEIDPLTLKKGDKVYIEIANHPHPKCSEFLFEIKSVQQNRKTSDSNNNTFVSLIAIAKPGGEKIKRTRKIDTEELGLPTERYSSTTSFFAQVFFFLRNKHVKI